LLAIYDAAVLNAS